MTDPLIVALQDATSHGFTVSIRYARHTNGNTHYVVSVAPWYVKAGEATERVAPFRVARPDLVDALGNALAVVGVEIGIDRAAKAKRLGEAE